MHREGRLVWLMVTLVACTEGERPRASSADVPVAPEVIELSMRPLVVPSAADTVPWIGRLDLLQIDPSSGNLFALDRIEKQVVEFTPSGEFVRSYGGVEGVGPGEMSNLFAYEATPASVFLLDEAAPKILRMDRNGNLAGEYRLDVPTVEFAVADDTILYTVPSRDGLYNVFVAVGDTVASKGSRGDPKLRDPSGCRTACKLVFLSPDTLLALQGNVPRILILAASSGDLIRSINLNEMPLVQGWIAEEAALLEEHAGSRPAGATVSKNFVWQLTRRSNGGWVMTLLPPRAGITARQMWILEPDWTLSARYEFTDPMLGNAAVVHGQTAFAIHLRDGGVYWSPLGGGQHQ